MSIKSYRKPTRQDKRNRKHNIKIALLSVLFIFIGVALFSTGISGSILTQASQSAFLTVMSPETLSQYRNQGNFEFRELKYKRANWKAAVNIPKEMTLDIPKADVVNARVLINSTDLNPDDFIGHLSGSALPGELGETILYAHSTIPFWFREDNYKSIFSRIDRLTDGDLITLSGGELNLNYRVEKQIIINPEEIDTYLGDTSSKTLILMTCYPFGSTDQRLLIFAKAIN